MHRRQFVGQLVKALPAVVLGAPLLLSRLSASDSATYTVQRGDTLSAIARRHGVSVNALRQANGITGDHILVGQTLILPTSADSGPVYHVVVRGDTLSAIALSYGATVSGIRTANGLSNDTIIPGQKLLIPGASRSAGGYRYINNVVQATSRLSITPNRWKYIVGHHSAIDRGNAAIYDRAHRRRRMENGLAYHFVIGNGKDSGNGEVEIGGRWLNQLDGGHVRNHAVNQTGIGICVIGNFEEQRPTPQQIAAFQELALYLKYQVLGGDCRFTVHREVDRNHTVCPGRFFPTRALHQILG